MRTRIRAAVILSAMLMARSVSGGEPITLSLVPLSGTDVTGGALVTVEAFLTANVAIGIRGGQIDLPCSLPGQPRSTGSIEILPGSAGGTTDPDGDGSRGPSAHGVPYLFGPVGLGPYSSINCIIATTPPLLPANVPAGATRYLGTFYYRVSDCATGSFDAFFECADRPGGVCDGVPESTNTTRYRDTGPGQGALIPFNSDGATLSVPVGTCCNGQACAADGLNEFCCAQTYPNSQFVPGLNCMDVDPCDCAAECACDPVVCCLPDGTCSETDPGCCSADGGSSVGTGSCSANEACCLPDAPCTFLPPVCCEARGGVVRGFGTPCAAPEACCLPDGSCFEVDPACCESFGGVAAGSGTVCAPAEACRFPDGTCQSLVSLCCGILKGLPQGGGSVCSEPEACCFSDSDCRLIIPEACAELQGVSRGPGSDCSAPEACCDFAGRAARGVGQIYWTEFFSATLRRANRDGSDAQTLYAATEPIRGVAVDEQNGKVYWTEGDSPNGRVRRANLDGLSIEDIITGHNTTLGIAVDSSAGLMFWAESTGVWRASLDGSAPQLIANNGHGVALAGGHVYWTTGSQIRRALLDGSQAESVFAQPGATLRGIAVDTENGWIYFTQSPPQVRRVRLSGAGVDNLADGVAVTMGLALDLLEGKMYWTDIAILRADLDGSNAEQAIGAGFAFGIALTGVAAPADCQPNGTSDVCDLFNGTSQDCDGNGIPDECDLAESRLTDNDGNGIPDVCEDCGDGQCTPPETACTCAKDCGPATPEGGAQACADGLDNDCDAAVDCADPDCAGTSGCAIPTVSAWGLIVLGLILLASAKLILPHRGKWNMSVETE